MESREEILANFQACTGIEVSVVLEGWGAPNTIDGFIWVSSKNSLS